MSREASSGPLRVVFLIRSFGFPEGMAATNRVRLLGRGLLEQGADVRVLCLRVSEWPGEIRNRATRGTADGIPFLYTCGATVRSESFMRRRIRGVRGYIAALALLTSLHRADRLDCVYFADGGVQIWRPSDWLLHRWLGALGVPVVSEFNEASGTIDWLPRRLSRRLSPVNNLVGVVAISSWLVDWVNAECQRLDRSVQVIEIPIVVDTAEHATATESQAGRTFVYSASASRVHVRDLQFVLAAMRKVWSVYPDSRLKVTGMKPAIAISHPALEGLQHEVDAGRLAMAGYVSRRQLAAEFRTAAALLIPLHDDRESRARFPSKIGEYLASARPVVTCDVGEIKRFLLDGKTAYVAPPEDLDAFAAKMIEVLDDPQQAVAVGAAGRRVAEEAFDYRLQGPRMKEFIEQVRRTAAAKRGRRQDAQMSTGTTAGR